MSSTYQPFLPVILERMKEEDSCRTFDKIQEKYGQAYVDIARQTAIAFAIVIDYHMPKLLGHLTQDAAPTTTKSKSTESQP